MKQPVKERGWPATALVRRELLTELRRPRAFGVVFLLAVITLAAAALNWPDNVFSVRYASYFATQYFESMAFVIFFAVVLCLPALSANAIVGEREQDTFDLVRMSLVTSTGYVLAKAANAFGLLLTLLVGITPVIATVFFLAGIDIAQVGFVLLILAATGMSVTAVSLASSAFCRRTLQAVVGSYLGIGIISVVPVVLLFFVIAFLYSIGVPIRSFRAILDEGFQAASPVGAFFSALSGDLKPDAVARSVIGQLAISICCLSAAVWKVHRPASPPRYSTEKPIDDPRVLAARRKTFPYYLIDPLRKRPPVEDKRNPMLVREIRWGLMNRGSTLVRIFYVALPANFFIAGTNIIVQDRHNDIRPWVVAQIVMILCVAPALLANAFTKERELGNIDMLRMTLLSGREIVYGKLVSGLMTLAPVVVAAVLSIVPLYLLAGLRDVDAIVTGYVTLTASAILALSLSLVASLFAPRTSAAIALGYALTVLAFAGFAFAGYWLSEQVILPFADGELRHDVLDQRAKRIGSFLSPLTAYYQSVDYSLRRREFSIDYTYWLSNLAVTILASAICVGFVARYFEKYRMRDR